MAKKPRFSRRERTPQPSRARGILPRGWGRGASLRFRDRTPSASSGGGTMGASGLARGRFGRDVAARIALICLALCLVVAWVRPLIGDVAPSNESALQIFRAPDLPAIIDARLEPVASRWWETFAAFGVWGGEIAQQLDPQEIGPRAALWLIVLLFIACAIWFALAQKGDWKRPSLPLCALLILQLFGVAYYLSSFRSPSHRLQTSGIAFDFHTHTTRSNGLMTPQQQINWHRARGFRGLAFTDSDRLMPRQTLQQLQAANPDMLLVNGCEFHGRDAHLLFFGLKRAISSREMDVPRAIIEAKKQGAIVIAPHPWSSRRYSPTQLRALGVDGFEAWNGVIGDVNLANEARRRDEIVVGATDTLSKSGARCAVWTLLPRGLNDEGDVLRALRRRKTGVAHTLNALQTPQNFAARKAQSSGPRAALAAIGAAWATLSRAQKINALLGLIGFVALLWAWGAERAPRSSSVSGPQSAERFLRRRRLVPRMLGALSVMGAFALSIGVAIASMSGTWKDAAWAQSMTPIVTLIVWPLCIALFLWGRTQWKRVQ